MTNWIGRGERIRTSDSCVPNAVLYQAELHPVFETVHNRHHKDASRNSIKPMTARKNQVKNRNVQRVHEDFEPGFNTASAVSADFWRHP